MSRALIRASLPHDHAQRWASIRWYGWVAPGYLMLLAVAVGEWDACGLSYRFTQQALNVISQASEEAGSSGNGWIETEHELLALLAVQDGIVSEVFAELGITIDRVRELVSELPGPSRPPVGPSRTPMVEGQLPFSTSVNRVHSRASQALSVGSPAHRC